MASLTIRDLDDSLKKALRLRAARNGRSMEEEARQVLRRALAPERPAPGLGSRIVGRFRSAGGVNLPEVSRAVPRRPPTFRSGDPK